MDEWGRRGLKLVGKKSDKIVEIRREWKRQLTLVVYPWPDNVKAGDRNSIQSRTGVSGQRSAVSASSTAWSFFQEPPDVAVGKYFIQAIRTSQWKDTVCSSRS